ncbi:hypothetical protein [Nocardia sp. NPDC057227]|uniref:hypothetical protein n=1 Tax=Nocardia sp. NPDC057227 TaxID=3346056 RepID=UPI003635A5F5
MTPENFPAATATAEAQDRCDAWNRAHPQGTQVRYFDGVCTVETATTSPAMVVGRTAAIHLACRQAPTALAVLESVTPEEGKR